MGGYGSGSWARFNSKETTESCKRIDTRYLKKHNLLYNSAGQLSWNRNGEPSGWIRYQTLSDRMKLYFKAREYGEEWESIEQTVLYDWTDCNYGGKRAWFLCPAHGCEQRVSVLYGAGKIFACRHCYQLTYTSQQENNIDRLYRKCRKIREKLAGSDNLEEPIWEKPKGMHWTTYKLLTKKERKFNLASFQELNKYLCKIKV